MDQATLIVQSINSMLWGVYCLIPLLVGTGIYFTWKLRFVQVKRLGEALRQVLAIFHFSASLLVKTGCLPSRLSLPPFQLRSVQVT